MRISTLFMSTALAAIVTACAPVPHLDPRAELRTPTSVPATQSFVASSMAWPSDAWWHEFADPQLDALIAEGLAGSPDAAAAAARARAADALVRQARGTLLPSLTANGSAVANKQTENLGIPPAFVPKGVNAVGTLSAALTFDPDLWGKNRATLAAATSEAEAAKVDAEQARLMLTTAIATAYADLAQYYQDRDVAVEALRVRQTTADLTAQREAIGVDNRGSLAQAQALVPAARADILLADEAIALTKNRIAALIGNGPDRGLTITRPQLGAPQFGIPEDVAIDLIGRRPDIVAARLRAEAAASRIEVVHADFYPNINLSAIVGLQALGLGNLLRSTSSYGNAGPALSLPIFNGGQIAGRYRQVNAEYDGAVAQYNGTLITAFREVADALASRRDVDARVTDLNAALASAREARDIAQMRYRGGLASLLPVLQADDSVITIERTLSQSKARKLALNITLVRALGGGAHVTPLTASKGQR